MNRRPSQGMTIFGSDVRYGPQRFQAIAKRNYVPTIIAEWPRFRTWAKGTEFADLITADERHDARQVISSMIINNLQWEPQLGALTASAITWLASTSAVGITFGLTRKHLHYEVTDQPPIDGRPWRNFRLMLTDEPADIGLASAIPVARPDVPPEPSS